MKTLTQRFGSHVFEPVWRTRDMLLNQSVPTEIFPWLFDQGSLTRRIISHCDTQFRVELLSLKWQRPMLNEAMRLGVHAESYALIREVLLYCGEQPWVYARSVLPNSTLTGKRRILGKLGNRPLGEILFSDPTIKRDALEVAEIQQHQRMFDPATQSLNKKPDSVWARRSVFYLHKKPLLVNEVFLPALFY